MKKIILGKRIVTSIYNTGIVLRALSSQTFSEMGFEITPEQYLILDLIIENGALYQRQIAEITLKDRGNVARIIKILEEKNLITKSQATQRRRIYKISVTEKGRELRDKMKPVTENLRRTFAKDVSEEELTITLNTLKKVYENARGLVKLQI
ncbi:MAG: MarR family winged helix-turn-helix transcriptional regulator [Candidatus Avigastranaerophilus sp.]